MADSSRSYFQQKKEKNKLTKYYEKYKSTILRAELIMLYANVLIILCFIYRSTTTTGNQ